MKFKRLIGKYEIVTYAADDLSIQVESLFDKIEEFNTNGQPINSHMTIEFGWSELTLVRDENELVVCEPDFFADPSTDLVPQVDYTLGVLTDQITLLQLLGVEARAAKYSDKIIVAKGCLKKERIYLERVTTKNKFDSGWYIGNVEDVERDKKVDDYEVVYVYQLLKIRPSIMQLLALPPGFLAIMQGKNIEAIFDSEGKEVW